MGFLGSALATYLAEFRGLYSVQLPQALRPELVRLVADLNSVTPRRGIYVSDLDLPGAPLTSRWAEALRWRTADDRIFVWERGAGEPDSSFQSAVRDFIGPRFPVDGSICDLATLATLVVRHLFASRGLSTSGPFFDGFANTAAWVADAYALLFREIGSSTVSHWTDGFLVEWSDFCDHLPLVLDRAVAEGLQPRFAWDIVRVAGLVVPQLEAGSPFGNSPVDHLPHEKALTKYIKTWQQVVGNFLGSSSHRVVLLNELDRRVQGAGSRTPWRDLPWNQLDQVADGSSAAAVGRRVFAAPSSVSVIGPQPPVYPAAPDGTWWGVTEEDLQAAIDEVKEERPVEPLPSSQTVIQPFQSTDNYLLATRTGSITFPSTAKKWRCAIQCPEVELQYRGRWKSLFVEEDEPGGAIDGDAWIHPGDIEVKISGKGVSATVANADSVGGLLRVTCNIKVEYSGAIDATSQRVTSEWDPHRSLALILKIYNRSADGFAAAREARSQMELVVPSCLAPTIVLRADGDTVVSPTGDDEFVREPGAEQAAPSSTPEIKLADEDVYDVCVYDGTVRAGIGAFNDPSPVSVGDATLGVDPNVIGLGVGRPALADGTTLTRQASGQQDELAVIRILEEQPAAVSSGIVAVLQGKPAARRPPSNAATVSILGQHQTRVVRGICSQLGVLPFVSLFHTVVASGSSVAVWPDRHPATKSPLFIGLSHGSLPGIGSGPSTIFGTPEWAAFGDSLEEVCAAIGLTPESHALWLSGFDPSTVPSTVVRRYNQAHAALIDAAEAISPAETFWTSYPFSVVVVNGQPGKHFGQLEAVLLSPLHPVRLTWAHSVATFARHIDVRAPGSRELLGLAEGWNFPLVGHAPNATGGKLQLVAVPIDPGPERDFIQWSALATLVQGLVEVPSEATGLPLPWAGRSGINDKVVQRSLDDYLAVSPYVGSLVVDLRSVAQAPRSAEIDNAVLEFLTDASNPLVTALPGGARVWDSAYREGPPPSRDRLATFREKNPDSEVAFEWRSYQPPAVPSHSDVAFVENASVSLDVVNGTSAGFLGPLPLRRFLPADNAPGHMDQNFRPNADEDVLGLASLLRKLETIGSDLALRSSPSLQTLGIAQGGKWEVIGTLNLSPQLLALTLAGTTNSAARLLWEWRPSWLNPERQADADLARRPYYVVARIPASLSVGLASRQMLSQERINLMISELGRRAVGLATLYAAGDAHENAAAGFYDALQLLLPANVTTPAAWIRPAPWIQTIVPIDPLAELLGALGGKKFQRRADLLAVGCVRDGIGTHVCLTPIEVKHHGTPANPAPRPPDSDPELKRARDQLKQTNEVLASIRDALPATEGNTMVALGRRSGLAVLMDFALDFAAHPVPAEQRAKMIEDVLAGRCAISVGTPCLLWLAPGCMSHTGTAVIRNQFDVTADLRIEEAYVDPYAVPGLLWPGEVAGPNELFARTRLDDMMTEATSTCGPSSVGGFDLRPPLKTLLKIEDEEVKLEPVVEGPAPAPAPVPETPPVIQQAPLPPTPATPVQPPAPVYSSTPVPPTPAVVASGEQPQMAAPQLVVGSRQPGSRWTVLGKLATGSQEPVALDLDQPKVLGIFGYMGSGKSYLLGAVTEAAVQSIANLNQLRAPLAVIVFNYRRNASDRFELSSLTNPNADAGDVKRLADELSALPAAVRDMHVLALKGELRPHRLAEYGTTTAQELLFRPSTLHVEDWELLMGEPDANRLYSQLMRHALIQLREQGDVSVTGLRTQITAFPNPGSRNAANQRLTFAERHLSESAGINFSEVVQPGRVLVIDLRQPLFSRDDALRFFLVCANQISRVQGQFNKMVIFDEAHEYLSEAFGEKLDSRIRLSRHEGTSYVFATQDVGSIPTEIQRFISTKFVFGLGSNQNAKDLLEFAPEFKGFELVELPTGQCFVQSTYSSKNFFSQPRLIRVRPRASAHGGATRIFA